MTFDEIKWPAPTISHLIASNDGINWTELKQYDFGWRDPSLAQFDDYWYVIYTGGIVRTKDWEQFERLPYPIEKQGCMTWAPEWVNDSAGWHIFYPQTPPNGTEQDFDLYVVNFDPVTGSTDMATSQKVAADYVKGSPIDPNVNFINGWYYLWVRERDLVVRLYRSEALSGPYTPVTTNFPDVQSGLNDEGPEMIQIDGQWVLYSDPWAGWIPKRRLYYSTAVNNDLTNWSSLKPIEGLNYMPRHFGLIKQRVMNIKILMLGDSITEGWNGSIDVAQPEAYFVQTGLSADVTNLGHGGGAIIGDLPKDLPQVVASTDFRKYDVVTVAYGVNDFDGGTGTLNELTEALNKQLKLIREQNDNILLIGILPIYGNTDEINGDMHGFSQMQDALADVYKSNGGLVLDWRNDPVVTPENYAQKLADKWLHPNQATYAELGHRIALFIRQNLGLSLAQQWVPITSIRDLKRVMNNNLNLFTRLLQQLLDQLNYQYSETLVNVNIVELTSENLDLILYKELRDVFQPINYGLQMLVDVSRKYKVKDEDGNFYEVPQTLAVPRRLTIDSDYINQLNKNWRIAFDALRLYQTAIEKDML